MHKEIKNHRDFAFKRNRLQASSFRPSSTKTIL